MKNSGLRHVKKSAGFVAGAVAGAGITIGIVSARTTTPDVSDNYVREYLEDAGGAYARFEGPIRFGFGRDVFFAVAIEQVPVVELNSNGGLIVEGLLASSHIQSASADTRIRGICNSACFIAFLGGEQRILTAGSTIGCHRGLNEVEDTETAAFQADWISVIERNIPEFSDMLVEQCNETPNSDVLHLNVDDLVEWQIVTHIEDEGVLIDALQFCAQNDCARISVGMEPVPLDPAFQ